jgi:serine protease AprX
MSRKMPLLSLVLVGAIAATSLTAPASAAATLDPSLPVQPALQYGAQAQPEKRVRVLVQKKNSHADSAAIAASAGTRIEEEFSFIHTVVLEVPQRVIPALARNPQVGYISPDDPVRTQAFDPTLLKTTYDADVAAPKLWNNTTPAYQATGKGVGVAVVDTGANAAHPDFAPGQVQTINVNPMAQTANDLYGHGTYVSGIIAGHSASGTYVGVAPDARLISVKISDDSGVAHSSDLIRGLQWVYDNRVAYNIRLANLSVTAGTAESYKTSAVAAAAEQLWFNGVAVVVAAGNLGTSSDAVWYAPANDPYVITVGCLDDNQTGDTPTDDSLCTFSSRGTTQDGVAKPDVVAPGRKVVSTLAGPNSSLAITFPDRITDTNYIRLSGTSGSAPVVTGTLALLLERYPNLTNDQLKYMLRSTMSSYPGQTDGAGLISAYGAIKAVAAGRLGVANQGLVPNYGISSSTGAIDWTTAYWNTAYWNTAYWNSAYWDTAYWDTAYWNSAGSFD